SSTNCLVTPQQIHSLGPLNRLATCLMHSAAAHVAARLAAPSKRANIVRAVSRFGEFQMFCPTSLSREVRSLFPRRNSRNCGLMLSKLVTCYFRERGPLVEFASHGPRQRSQLSVQTSSDLLSTGKGLSRSSSPPY